MTSDLGRLRARLKQGSFRELFIEELGWDRHEQTIMVAIEGKTWSVKAIAEKRGMVAYVCTSPPGVGVPDYSARRKIERRVEKAAHEHLIVFTDSENGLQIWQWVRQEPGKPIAVREHLFRPDQTGEALAQKLRAIAFTLTEEETLTLTDVTRRARVGFDVERVTKRFYDQFKKEHASFLKFVTGIAEVADREWYGSLMLNRLMFVYFIQRKGFLDGDPDYLRHRLARSRADHGFIPSIVSFFCGSFTRAWAQMSGQAS